MELRQIQYFVAIAEAEHFGRASQRLRIAQPALSRQMKLLEARLGVALFERLPRGVRLTEAGRSFLALTRGLDRQLQDATEAARSAAKGHQGRLRLSFIEAVAWHGLIPDALRKFREHNPQVELGLHAMATAEQIAALRRDETDAALVYNAIPTDDLAAVPLADHDVVLAVPADSAMALRDSVSVAELCGMPLVGFPRSASPTFHDEVQIRFRALGLTPHYVAEFPAETEILALVSAGAGLALSNACQMNRQPRGVRFVRLTDLHVSLRLCLVHRKGDVPPTLARFLDILRESTMQKETTGGLGK
jgi:DNA-binding transcriptional LysR family regulator